MYLLFALFSNEPEVFLPEYSQPAILHAAHFQRVVNTCCRNMYVTSQGHVHECICMNSTQWVKDGLTEPPPPPPRPRGSCIELLMGPLTLKFNRATWPLLKINMRHGAYRHETKFYRHDIGHSLNSTCDIKPF